ncbi:olfactory receptor 14C36-like [Anolis carolinensis]|uniref:olfactory receptor 14C36-like n=1 Tax=Anolis carolinensis TaxID=28377 RepID=UPI000203A2A9|nr:PREDICTED: olfactory receptor 14C36-like [Anolis carolinensis]|eukprot:XP_016851289.1 PREDICTED: olfactory receptor 14C36-like [Anolis carolinensis]
MNKSTLSGFLLLEFSDVWELQILHFILFLIFYLTATTANLLIVSAITSDYHLHIPMYFLLMNLAIQDVGQISVIFPASMANSLMNDSHISYSGCIAQVLFHVFFISSDYFLLTVMAYDRYVAICTPLQYEMVMNRHTCLQMVMAVWIISLFYAVLHTVGTFSPAFCSNVVNQFFCEIPHLLRLVCSKLYLIEIGILLLSAVVAAGCFVFIIVTYVHIFTVVMRFPAGQGRKRTFSTCLPHLTVFSVFIFTSYLAYYKPASDSSSLLDLAVTMIYSMVPPLMNPLIYSIRNKEIKNALKKLIFTYNRKLLMLMS